MICIYIYIFLTQERTEKKEKLNVFTDTLAKTSHNIFVYSFVSEHSTHFFYFDKKNFKFIAYASIKKVFLRAPLIPNIVSKDWARLSLIISTSRWLCQSHFSHSLLFMTCAKIIVANDQQLISKFINTGWAQNYLKLGIFFLI